MTDLETDYLVVGAGAVAMAFVDTLLAETNADIVMVDEHHAPGGHWCDAYPFVRLHQPSAFYGVASLRLGEGRIDRTGWNAGYFELACGSEVAAHFDRAMREVFLPSGRVRYFPMHRYEGEGRIRPLLGGSEFSVRAHRKTVDTTYLGVTVPSTHERPFSVADDVACIPPNDLPRRAPDHRRFVLLGGGKTAMDAAIWMLEAGADPDAITWVIPRDGWVFDRAGTQPDARFFEDVFGRTAAQFEACAAATSVEDLFERLEAGKVVHRIFDDVFPTMFHFPTLSRAEAAELRRITRIVRGHRVRALGPGRMAFETGEESVPEDALFIDCTAAGATRRPTKPVFDGDLLTIQMVRLPQPTFSAALIARLEATLETDEEKNALAAPTPLTDSIHDWPASMLVNMTNQYMWGRNPELRAWMRECRLDGFGGMASGVGEDDQEKQAILQRMKDAAFPAVENLQKLAAAQPAA
ncbi:MAG: NAD(P)/FAD-dependent oxidoreductase [Pseudomonadota bacterium]